MLDLYNIIYQLSYIETDTLDLHFKSALGNHNYQLDCISTYVCLVPSSKNVTLLKVLPLLIFIHLKEEPGQTQNFHLLIHFTIS